MCKTRARVVHAQPLGCATCAIVDLELHNARALDTQTHTTKHELNRVTKGSARFMVGKHVMPRPRQRSRPDAGERLIEIAAGGHVGRDRCRSDALGIFHQSRPAEQPSATSISRSICRRKVAAPAIALTSRPAGASLGVLGGTELPPVFRHA